MEYQNTMNLLDNTPCQPSKLKTKIWVEINNDSHIERTAPIAKLNLKLQC